MKRLDFWLVLLCLLFLSNTATYFITRDNYAVNHQMELQPAKKTPAWGDNGDGVAKTKLLLEIWDLLDEKYIEPLEYEVMVRGAIDGLIESLGDPHTRYFTPRSMEDMLIQTTGSFSGIGVVITDDSGEVLILRVFEGTPADRAGLSKGDRIVEVEGKGTEELTLDETARLLRGPRGTKVDIAVRKAGEVELWEVSLTRDDIEMDTVFPSFLEEGIGYIEITNFDGGTGDDFRDSLKFLESERALKGLIIDLRNNTGGLLNEALEVGGYIVPKGEITRLVDRDGNVLERHHSSAEPKDYPIVVLINGFTASAAEIIAGSLQESENVVLVGEPTYGKATIQQLHFLTDGSGLRYTIAKYLTPGGRDLHSEGLQPDYEQDLPEEFFLQFYSIPSDLKQGDTGEKVVLLQRMLHFLGFDIEITGVFDEQTEEGLELFQSSRGLSVTKQIDIATREQMRSDLNEHSRLADTQLQKAVKLLQHVD